jgi:hypothetical protein
MRKNLFVELLDQRRLLSFGLDTSSAPILAGAASDFYNSFTNFLGLDDGSALLSSYGYRYSNGSYEYQSKISRITPDGVVVWENDLPQRVGYRLSKSGDSVYAISVGGETVHRLNDRGQVQTTFALPNDAASGFFYSTIMEVAEVGSKVQVVTNRPLQSTQPTTGNPLSAGTIYQFESWGALDANFAPRSLELQPAEKDTAGVSPTQKYTTYLRRLANGKYVGVGSVTYYAGFEARALNGTSAQVTRWNADGTLDNSFSGNGVAELDVLQDFVQVFGEGRNSTPNSNESLIVRGHEQPIGGSYANAFVRVLPSGEADASLGGVGGSSVPQKRLPNVLSASQFFGDTWNINSILPDGRTILTGSNYSSFGGNILELNAGGQITSGPGLILSGSERFPDGRFLSTYSENYIRQPDGSYRLFARGDVYARSNSVTSLPTGQFVVIRKLTDDSNPQFLPTPVQGIASAIVPGESIDLSWTPQPGATSQELVRTDSDGNGRVVFRLGAGIRSYRDTTAVLDGSVISYVYSLSTINGSLQTEGGFTSVEAFDRLADPQNASTPSGLRIVRRQPGEITIAWDPIAGNGRVQVYRREVGSGWELSGVPALNGNSFVDLSTNLQAGKTYEYAIRATYLPTSGLENIDPNGFGFPSRYFTYMSPLSERVRAVAIGSTPSPAPVFELLARSLPNGDVRVSWNADSAGGTKRVEYRLAGQSNWSTGVEIGSGNGADLSGLSFGNTYEIRVVTLAGGNSSAGETVVLRHVSPTQPFNPNAIPGPWEKIEAENFDVGPAGVSFRDQEPRNAGRSGYRSSAGPDVVDNIESDGSPGISYTRQGEMLVYTIRVPTAGRYVLQARAANADNQQLPVRLQFTFNDQVRSEMSISPTGTWSQYETFSTDPIELPAGTYTMKVEFVGESFFSNGNYNWFRLLPEGQFAPPGDVRDLSVDTSVGSHELFWTPGTNSQQQIVQRRVAGYQGYSSNPWLTQATLPANARTFASGFFNSTGSNSGYQASYEYRVLSTNWAGQSSSNVAIGNAADPAIDTSPPAAPGSVVGTYLPPVAATDVPAIELRWSAAQGANFYRVLRSDQPDSYYTVFDSGGTLRFVVNDGIVPGESYTFTIVSVKYPRNYGDAYLFTDSDPITIVAAGPVVTLPEPPVSFVGSFDGASANLNWTDRSNNETGFVLQRRYRGEPTFSDLANLPAGTQYYSDSTVLRNVVYDYRIVATNAAGRMIGPVAQVTTQATASLGGVSGRIWFDANYNSTRDADESYAYYYGSDQRPTRKIFADVNNNKQLDAGEPSIDVSTSQQGSFSLVGVPAGNVTLRMVPVEGFYQSFPWSDNGHVVNVPAGQTVSGFEFGTMVIPTLTLTGASTGVARVNGQLAAGVRVFADLDGDRIHDADEPTARSNIRGRFELPVKLKFGRQLQLVSLSSAQAGSKVRTRLDADGTTLVYTDRNKNKRFDAGDRVMRSTSLFFDANSNGMLDVGETLVQTSRNGRISFSDLPIDADGTQLRVVKV